MKKGQIFSLDAFVALTMTIILLGTISTTSDSIREAISSIVEWYERVNIPDNMLDVLLKTPGEPPNWNDNITNAKSFGLKEEDSPFVSYEKALVFFDLIKKDDSKVLDFLRNLSLGKPFCLEFYLGIWNFTVNFTWNPDAGGISGNFDVYSGSCTVTGTQSLKFGNPTIIQCSPLIIRGSASITSDSPLCILGDVNTDGSLDITVGHYPPTLGGPYPYLAIDGDWTINGSVTVRVGGSVYIDRALIIRGQGSRQIDIARDLVIFGDTINPYLIDVSGVATVNIGIQNYLPGNLYIKVGNIWYASNRTGEWYEWTGSGWERVNEPQVISYTSSFTLNIYGYPLPDDWTPPSPPPCFILGELPLSVSSASLDYTYPQVLERSQAWARAVYYKDNLTTVLIQIPKNASWVEYASRAVTVDIKKYNMTIEVSSNYTRLISGVLKYTPPAYARFEITVPNETGYALFIILDGEKTKLLGVTKSAVSPNVQAYLWKVNATGRVILQKTYVGNETSIIIPWIDVFSEVSSERGKPVEMWIYETNFNGPVYLIDEYNIGLLLDKRYELGLVKLWVWDER
ncbi:hypothetical protein [Pyrococcus sp. ST04]|uniref:hypothetical protein n=1 Tax=Pyrococcus sp. ST04 TaxID=1183377 RepID=UPI0002605B08|nr:hypothetical protein [Pyrococcus sp. ST04]AFK22819.1 hypothetical protein Py04_1245 [Pyrococcus sp. ST04]